LVYIELWQDYVLEVVMTKSKKSNVGRFFRQGVMKALAVTCVVLMMTACAGKEAPPEVSFDGMVLIKHSKSGAVYRKQGVDLSQYNQFILLPSAVGFKKDWKKDYNRDHRGARVKDSDVDRIKRDLAKLFDEVFTEELSDMENFSRVTEVGENVLLLRPAMINLNVNAPDLKSVGRDRTYVDRAGEGTLYLEAYDSVSSEILARVIDARGTRDSNFYSWSNKATNQADAKALLRRWAKALHKKLDEIHAPLL
jgi:hypothetical protein